MLIDDDVWVTVRYRLFDAQGDALEPMERELTYLHGGYGSVFPAIEQALAASASEREAAIAPRAKAPERSHRDTKFVISNPEADMCRASLLLEPPRSIHPVPPKLRGESPDHPLSVGTKPNSRPGSIQGTSRRISVNHAVWGGAAGKHSRL